MSAAAPWLTQSIYFGIVLTVAVYQIGILVRKKTGLSFLSPLLVADVLIIVILLLFKIDVADYQTGGTYISYLLGPATVCLAVPLYKSVRVLKGNLPAVLIGVLAGSITAILSVTGLAALFNLPDKLFTSMLAKSVTAAIAAGITEELGGDAPITVASVMVTGVLGGAFAPLLIKLFRLTDKVAIGLAIGTSSHSGGTARALEMGDIEGGMSSIAIAVAGVFTVILAPVCRSLSLFVK